MNQDTPVQQILLKLKSAFPEAVTETKQTGEDGKPYYAYSLKNEFVRQLQGAGLEITDDQNRYELQFPGKETAKAAVFTPSHKTLVADKDQSKNFDDTGNLFIEGDNLDVLKMLQNSYRGRIKMIYIDPPYNTGGDDFIYNDNFSIEQKEYLRNVGVLDEEGERQVSEIQSGLKGRFHAGWLAFMYPRLKLARELLRDDGVIFISIDDNEQANLKLICDEIFGEESFISSLVWENKEGGGSGDSKHFKIKHEYVLVYGKSKEEISIGGVGIEDEERYKLKDEHFKRRGMYQLVKLDSASIRQSETLVYPIEAPDKTRIMPNGCWRWSKDKFVWGVENDFIVIKKNRQSEWTVYSKQYLNVDNEGNLVRRDKRQIGVINKFSTTQSNRRIKELFGCITFKYSKPYELIELLLKISTDNDAVILDFFAGSGTTGESVMQLNAKDGGHRKFILVQLPEVVDSKKSKEANQFCSNKLKRPANVAEIAKERIRRAGKQISEEHNREGHHEIDTGFRAFVVTDSLLFNSEEQPLAQTEQAELQSYTMSLGLENFEPLLYEALLKTGTMLDLPLLTDEVAGYPIAICDRRCYCVTENLTQEIVQKIAEKHGENFDILYYLSDAPGTTTSFTEIEAAIRLAPGNKQVQGLTFY